MPAAVLAALIAPILIQVDEVRGSLDGARLLAAGVAVAVAWRWRNALLTLVVGLGCLWLLETIL